MRFFIFEIITHKELCFEWNLSKAYTDRSTKVEGTDTAKNLDAFLKYFDSKGHYKNKNVQSV